MFTDANGDLSVKKVLAAVLSGIIVVVLAVFCLGSFERVDATEHCVETKFGRVVNPKVENGLVFTPITQLTCFPTTQQQFPGNAVTGEEASVETVSILTRDSVNISADIAILWKYSNPNDAFATRRSHDAVLSEITNALRSGGRDAGAMIGLPDLMGAKRAGIDEIFRDAINKQMSDYATIEKVYIRKIEIPANIQALWTQTLAQQAEQTKARAAFITDSLNARRTVVTAEAEARKVELETRALASSQEVLRLRMAEAMANGLSNVCGRASTCIIGGSVMDTWKTGSVIH